MDNPFSTWVQPGLKILQPYQAGRSIESVQQAFGLDKVIKLASNENPLGPSPLALEALQCHLAPLSRYPDHLISQLKTTLALYWNLPSNAFTLGAGSEALFFLIAQTFVAPNQSIMIPQYGFATFELVARQLNRTVQIIPAKGYGADLGQILANITPNTKLIFLANPNNPTGTYIEYTQLIDFIERLPRTVLLVLDQAYAEFIPQEQDFIQAQTILAKYPHVIITRTFSKLYGLAGLRLGYSASSPDLAYWLERAKLPFSVSETALVAGLAALDDKAHVKATLANNSQGLLQFETLFKAWNLTFLPPLGNFITLLLDKPARPVFETLMQKGVIVRPLDNYGLPQALRISIGLPEENTQCLRLLRELL